MPLPPDFLHMASEQRIAQDELVHNGSMKLDAVRRFALSLPETAEAPHFDFTSFRVRGKIFCTAPPTGTHVHVFVGDEDRESACATYPAFIEKLWWGQKVLGVRIALADARAAIVRDLLKKAWARKAPKLLLP